MHNDFQNYDIVFPAHTGVFLMEVLTLGKVDSLPRTHGGVSGAYGNRGKYEKSSPHTRGCFL